MRRYPNAEAGTAGFLCACFLVGLCIGAVFANLSFPYRMETTLLKFGEISRQTSQEYSASTYFYYLLEIRLRMAFLLFVAGFTSIARPAAIASVGILGFLAGAMGAMMALEEGFVGFLWYLLTGLPQCLCYVPALFLLIGSVYERQGRIRGSGKNAIKGYLKQGLLCLVLIILGVILEAFINPGLVKWSLKFIAKN